MQQVFVKFNNQSPIFDQIALKTCVFLRATRIPRIIEKVTVKIIWKKMGDRIVFNTTKYFRINKIQQDRIKRRKNRQNQLSDFHFKQAAEILNLQGLIVL